jgi:hypothetical protein
MVTPGERLCARLAEVDRFERLPARRLICFVRHVSDLHMSLT